MKARVHLLGIVVLALLLAGCGGSGSPKAGDSQAPGQTPTATSTVTSPTPAATPDDDAVLITPKFSLDVPDGWVVQRSAPPPAGQPDDGAVCLTPRDDTEIVFGCAGIQIDYGPHLPGAEMSAYAPNQGDGWYHATDVEPCPFVKQKPSGPLVGIRVLGGMDQGLRPVGRHKADWNSWIANCNGRAFDPQAWYLPETHVVIFDYVGHGETAAVLASARFASDGDALPPAASYFTGHVVSGDGGNLTVQPFVTYITGPAGKAYAQAHHLAYPFPDDYYDADTGAVRTIAWDATTSCQGDIVLTQQSGDLPVPCTAYAQNPHLPVKIWLRADGSVESLAEIFRP
jgi:hypothetical protein